MSPRLSIIPAGAVTDRALEPRDLQVLCLLGRHIDNMGWCTRSQVKMARELSCSRSSVQRSIERLGAAGWIELKRRGPAADEDTHPSNSYAYRVRLDGDEAQSERSMRAAHDRIADERSDESGGCPPVGTPSDTEGAQPDGHPGAQPYVGTRAQPYVGTKNDPLERSPIERERDARARERTDKFIAAFVAKWPTAAADDQQRIAYAASALTADEQQAALARIEPFLAYLKQIRRSTVPAGWTYLEQRRWTLLEQQQAETAKSQFTLIAPDSREARAVLTVHAIARASGPVRLGDGRISYPCEVTPQLLALVDAPPRAEWRWIEDRQQIGAWAAFVGNFVKTARPPFVEDRSGKSGVFAPWDWPPRKDGSMSGSNEGGEGERDAQDR